MEVVKDLTAASLLTHVRYVFAGCGPPRTLVGDNGRQLAPGGLFRNFLAKNRSRTTTRMPAEMRERLCSTHLARRRPATLSDGKGLRPGRRRPGEAVLRLEPKQNLKKILPALVSGTFYS